MSLPRPVRAAIFDMDGLLIDSERLFRDAMMGAAVELGHEMTHDFFLTLVGTPWAANVEALLVHYGSTFDTEALRDETWRRYHAIAQAELTLKAGVVEILDRLDELGLPRAIATSSRRETVEHHLGDHGVLHRFHAVVASGETARAKPHPDPYLLAAERLGVEPQDCLALEDSHNGVRAAAAAGMMTIMVPDLLDPTEEMRGLCVRIARDLHEVAGLLSAPAAGPRR
jgi:HAD superfamily hydrolase (TIGR01509 family)